MTFWTYLFANTALSLAIAAILIWTKPENRAKRAEAKMRREEDLFNMMLEAAKRIDEERKPNPEFTPPPEKKPPKPPTTGSSAIRPKERKYDELDAVAKLLDAYHKLGNAGASTTDEIAEKFNEIANAIDRTDKKPVTPERLKEAGFEVAPVHSCGSCYWFSEGGGGKFGLCIRNDEIADRDGQKACFDPQERRSKVRPKPIGTVTTR